MAKKKRKPVYVPKEKRPKKPMQKAQKRNLLIGIGAAALALLLLFVFYNDGSLRSWFGNISAQDNWIVVNARERGQGSKYYKLGEVGAIEGFTWKPDESIKTDKNEQDFYFRPDDGTSRVSLAYIGGVRLKPAAMAEEVHASFLQMYGEENVGAIKTGTLSGREATYFVTLSTEKQEDGTEKKTQQLTCYLPAVRDLSVLITLSLQVNDELPPLPDEEVLARAEPFAAAITFAEK